MSEDVRARLGMLQSLVIHPGWEAFMAATTTMLIAQQEGALSARTEREARGEYAAAYRVLADALSWPEREITDLTERLTKGERHG